MLETQHSTLSGAEVPVIQRSPEVADGGGRGAETASPSVEKPASILPSFSLSFGSLKRVEISGVNSDDFDSPGSRVDAVDYSASRTRSGSLTALKGKIGDFLATASFNTKREDNPSTPVINWGGKEGIVSTPVLPEVEAVVSDDASGGAAQRIVSLVRRAVHAVTESTTGAADVHNDASKDSSAEVLPAPVPAAVVEGPSTVSTALHAVRITVANLVASASAPSELDRLRDRISELESEKKAWVYERRTLRASIRALKQNAGIELSSNEVDDDCEDGESSEESEENANKSTQADTAPAVCADSSSIMGSTRRPSVAERLKLVFSPAPSILDDKHAAPVVTCTQGQSESDVLVAGLHDTDSSATSQQSLSSAAAAAAEAGRRTLNALGEYIKTRKNAGTHLPVDAALPMAADISGENCSPDVSNVSATSDSECAVEGERGGNDESSGAAVPVPLPHASESKAPRVASL